MKRLFSLNPAGRTLFSAMLSIAFIVCYATVVVASGGEGGHGGGHADSGAQMKDLMWRVIDFVILLLIIVWAVKKADAKKALKDRTDTIAKALEEAEASRAAAEKKFAEYNDKLKRANQEIQEIQIAIRKDGEAEKERIIAEANLAASRIKDQAVKTADQEVLKAVTELRREAASLAVKLAEQNLKAKVDKGDQERLVGEYLNKVVELQ